MDGPNELGVGPNELGVGPSELETGPNELGAGPNEFGVEPNKLGARPNDLGVGNDGGPRNKRKKTNQTMNKIEKIHYLYGNLISGSKNFCHKYFSGQKKPLTNRFFFLSFECSDLPNIRATD